MFFKFRILFQSADIEILKQKNAGRALIDLFCVKSNYEVVISTLEFSVLYQLLKLR
jgi:hypothetical protein